MGGVDTRGEDQRLAGYQRSLVRTRWRQASGDREVTTFTPCRESFSLYLLSLSFQRNVPAAIATMSTCVPI
jgi:hypothetical protein